MTLRQPRVVTLDRGSSEPLWSQLARALRELIETGRLVADQPLPSESELCEIYGVSRPVVREALRELVQRREIYKIKGKGTFVAPARADLHFVGVTAGSAEDLVAAGQRVMTQVLSQTLERATAEEAMALQITSGEPVVRLRRLRHVAGEPWLLVDTTLPAHVVPGLDTARLENRSLYDTLRRLYGIEVAEADRWLEAVIPDAETAALLEISPTTPLLGIESVAWTADGTRFEWYRALHRSDQARFHIGIRR